MRKAEKTHKCAECGGNLLTSWINGAYKLRCANSLEHTGIIRPFTPSVYDLPGYNMPGVMKTKEKELLQKYGTEKTKQIIRIGGGNPIATLTQKGATEMLSTFYPEAVKCQSGQAAIIKGALICRDYGLNPAMDHIFLIKYDRYENKGNQRHKVGEDWSVVRGIKASRLICAREKSYGYIDNTPRIMTEDEQIGIYGEVDKTHLVTVCKLKDKDGNEYPGYGRWPKDTEPKGVNKGNSKFNMSCIRAERQALDKLNPGAMPADVDVVDERFIEKPSITVETERPDAKQIPESNGSSDIQEGDGEVQSGDPEEELFPSGEQTGDAKTEAAVKTYPHLNNLGELRTRANKEGVKDINLMAAAGVDDLKKITDFDLCWANYLKARDAK